MIYTNSSDFGGDFKTEFLKELKKTTSITIATGYFDALSIMRYQNKFEKISKLGRVVILIGMVGNAKVSKDQNNALQTLDKKLRAQATGSGVFITMEEYHGKVYSFDKKIYVGSSNFSNAGLEQRLECNVSITDEKTRKKILRYLKFLLSQDFTLRLDQVDLKIIKFSNRDHRKKLRKYLVDSIPRKSIEGTFDVKLRVDKQPNSSLNLFFNKGRLSGDTGHYTRRPWYEVEITTTKDEQNNLYYPASKSNPGKKSKKGKFKAFIKVGREIYYLNMTVGGTNAKDIASSKKSGGRPTLGYIIKGQLERKGLLKYGERITSRMLEEYGRDTIKFTKFNDGNYLMEF